MTQNRFKEVHDISYNLITIQEQLFEIKFEKYGTFPHFTGFFFSFFGLWAWPKSYLYRSGIGLILSGTVGVFVVIRAGVRGESGYH